MKLSKNGDVEFCQDSPQFTKAINYLFLDSNSSWPSYHIYDYNVHSCILHHFLQFQACAELLETSEVSHYVSAVRELVRWYLTAVEDQLNTVVTASHLLAVTHRAMRGRINRKLIKDFPLEAVHPQTVVKVLEASIDEAVKVHKIEQHTPTGKLICYTKNS